MTSSTSPRTRSVATNRHDHVPKASFDTSHDRDLIAEGLALLDEAVRHRRPGHFD